MNIHTDQYFLLPELLIVTSSKQAEESCRISSANDQTPPGFQPSAGQLEKPVSLS